MKKLQFKVKYKANVNGQIIEGIQEITGWFYIDQRGKFLSSEPMQSINYCEKDYDLIQPLIKINNEFLTVEEIEERINK